MAFFVIFELMLVATINGDTMCPPTQNKSSNLLCHIFRDANIDTDISENNYCSWESSWIKCNSTTNTIIEVNISTFGDSHGPLYLEYPWPKELRKIDLRRDYDPSQESYFSGDWNWTSMQSLNNLKYLDLENNQFSINITNDAWNIIASMPSLELFAISNNFADSDLSKFDVNTSSTSKLTYMYSENSGLFGSMDVTVDGFFNSFSDLKHCYISRNRLSGSWPNLDAISYQNLFQLEEFVASNNLFSGSLNVSNTMQLSGNLIKFDVSENYFSGSVSWDIFKELDSLELLSLYKNDLSGSIDITILPNSLETIYLDGNNFVGNINWAAISKFDNLMDLDLGDNFLNGSISMSGAKFSSSIQYIYVYNNNFTGIDWSIFYNLSDLIRLDISDNSIEGTVEWSALTGLGNLQVLRLNNNFFTGPIDWTVIAELFNHQSLSSLKLDGNQFSGYVNFSWMKNSVWPWEEFTLDINILCDPIEHSCKNDGQVPSPRNSATCKNYTTCVETCECVDTMDPTTQPTIHTSTTQTITTQEQTSYSGSVVAGPNSGSGASQETTIMIIIIVVLIILLVAVGCIMIFIWMKSRPKDATDKSPTLMNIKHSIEFNGAIPNGNNQSFAQQNGLSLNSRIMVHSNEGESIVIDAEGNDNAINNIGQPGSPIVEQSQDKIVDIDVGNDEIVVAADEEIPLTPQGKDTPGSPYSNELRSDDNNIDNVEHHKPIVKYSFNSDADMEVISDMQTPIDNDINGQ